MRLILPIAFVIGLGLKLLHLPYHTIFLLVVVATGLVTSSIGLVRGSKKAATMAVLASWTWAFHLIVVLKLLPIQNVTLTIAFTTTIIAVWLNWRARTRTGALQVLLGVFILVMTVMSRPVSERYRITNLTWSLERETDVHSWDKYSFLLLRDGEKTEALNANEQAASIAERLQRPDLVRLVQLRREAIVVNEWSHYGPLP